MHAAVSHTLYAYGKWSLSYLQQANKRQQSSGLVAVAREEATRSLFQAMHGWTLLMAMDGDGWTMIRELSMHVGDDPAPLPFRMPCLGLLIRSDRSRDRFDQSFQ